MERIGIVGGGIVGLAIARRFLELRPDSSVTVLEKEANLASHQTGHNSGVVHAGVYYKPGSLKATLCRRGSAMLKEYALEHGVRYDECGKLIVALRSDELDRLEKIFGNGTANGVPGLRMLDPGGIAELEPHAAGVRAVHSPHTAIVDFPAVAYALGGEITRLGGRIRLRAEVDRLHDGVSTVTVGVGGEELTFDRVVLCGGLHSDRVARLAGDDADPRIIPFRGEYFTLKPDRSDLVKGLIYPVPDPRYPFLGVHFTRRVDGTVDVGPNAVLALAREGYRRRDVSFRDVAEILAWPGFRRMAREHWRVGVSEMHGSLSRRAFLKAARAYVPELENRDVVRAPSGVRAQAVGRDGALIDDFVLHHHGRIVSVRNAPSPAATSSLAIAEHVCAEVLAATP